jgi:hypothetical protein
VVCLADLCCFFHPSLVLFFLDSKVTAGENGSEQKRQVQNGSRDAKAFSCVYLIHGPK